MQMIMPGNSVKEGAALAEGGLQRQEFQLAFTGNNAVMPGQAIKPAGDNKHINLTQKSQQTPQVDWTTSDIYYMDLAPYLRCCMHCVEADMVQLWRSLPDYAHSSS